MLTRLAVTTRLDAWDIAALRFGVGGLLLAPVLVRRGLARDRLGRLGLVVLVSGLGVPYVLAAAWGLRFAPAADQGALNPGCMPLFVALIAGVALGETRSSPQTSGLRVDATTVLRSHLCPHWRPRRGETCPPLAFGS